MQLIPLFPLEMVVFPLEEFNLHIFEPRYRELIRDCQDDGIIFGIPFYKKDHPLKFGSTVALKEISKIHPDGKMDIKTLGLNPFEVNRYTKLFPNKTYPGGYVTDLFWDDDGNNEKYNEISARLESVYEFMKIGKRPEALSRDYITFEIAHKVGFNQEQEYHFLRIAGEEDRQDYMLAHLDKMVPMIKEAEEMRRKIQMNGHFKNVTPPKI